MSERDPSFSDVKFPMVVATQAGTKIYVLNWGDHYERRSTGPYLGASNLDFDALTALYRHDRYAAAEAALADHCWVDEGDFQRWLVEKGHLKPIQFTDVEVSIRTSSEDCYIPKHWPECPECGEGRGQSEFGAERRSLNRITTFHRCTACQHAWGHHEVPLNSSRPMLEDDGRDTHGGCVPFAISKACGIDWATTLAACTKHGWGSSGMVPDKAIVAARELGFNLDRQDWRVLGTQQGPTLKRLIAALRHDRNYIVAVKGHWLALVRGVVVDNDTDSGMGRKVLELYEVCAE